MDKVSYLLLWAFLICTLSLPRSALAEATNPPHGSGCGPVMPNEGFQVAAELLAEYEAATGSGEISAFG